MLTRWNDLDRTLATFDELRRRFEDAFDDVGRWSGYGGSMLRPLGAGGWPRVNIDDAGANVMVTVEVPGISERDVNVSLTQDVLTINGERKVVAPQGYAVQRQERSTMSFSRSFTLPCKVDAEKTMARVKDGLLTLTLCKAPEAQPRQITVKAS